MPASRELFLPRDRSWSRWAVAIAAVVHVVVAIVGRVGGPLPDWEMPTFARGPSAPAAGRMIPLQLIVKPRAPSGAKGAAGIHLDPSPSSGPVAQVATATELPLEMPTVAPVPPARADSGAGTGFDRLGPDLGDGKLWIRPLPLPPRELARRLTKGHVELVDSAVTVIVQQFLDSIASEPNSQLTKPPRWTRELAGKTWGIDAGTIYLGDLRIPTAILAFLPLSVGRPDQIHAAAMMEEMQRDLRYAAVRSATLDEFKRQIRELREKKESDRAFERNRQQEPVMP